MEILSIKDLNFTYPGSARASLTDISLSLDQGDFAVLCGSTGSGKSTLLRIIKRELAPFGERSGMIFYKGEDISGLTDRESACSIGYVAQNPEQQIVTDKVWHELVFGLENMHVPQEEIRVRAAETAAYFGIERWFDKSVAELSGGQKQILNLAGVMIMRPDILLLDEPTAMLDPIAASDFIAMLQRLNNELSLTIVIAEHTLEEVLPLCNKVIALKNGRLISAGNRNSVLSVIPGYDDLMENMPCAFKLSSHYKDILESCMTVKDARRFILDNFKKEYLALDNTEQPSLTSEIALELKNVYFRYSRNENDVLTDVSMKVHKGEVFCLLGGNGSGKSTLLSCIAGLRHIYAGSIKIFGRNIKDYKGSSLYNGCVSLLPQNVQTMFLHSTVSAELKDCDTEFIDMSMYMDKHPYDLSGGEQQLLALSKVLATKPKLLLLDEPTKGLDGSVKNKVIQAIIKLRDTGATVLIVTHDTLLASICATRCAMFFRGDLTACNTPKTFFSGNSFYTTPISRITRGIYEGITSMEDAVKICDMNRKSHDSN